MWPVPEVATVPGLGWEVGIHEVLRRLKHRNRIMWNDNDIFIGVSGI